MYDQHFCSPYQRALADYHVPVNIGEIGTTGIAAAIANAVYNATGKRIRSQPITPDKLM